MGIGKGFHLRREAAREFLGDVCAGPSRVNRGSSEGSMLANRPTSAADALYPCDSYLTLQWWASREKKKGAKSGEAMALPAACTASYGPVVGT